MRRYDKADAASRVARLSTLGATVTVVASGHAGFVGTTGRVVDETERTFLLETEGGREVRIPKRGQRFAFDTPDGRVEVDGAELAHHPSERFKRMR